MSLTLGNIFLYSFDPEKLFHFLSFLLDVEGIHHSDDTIEFIFHGTSFVIKQSEKKRLDKTTYFTLKTYSEEELINIKNNIEFYYYKEGESKFKIQLENKILEFSDPDNRSWRIVIE